MTAPAWTIRAASCRSTKPGSPLRSSSKSGPKRRERFVPASWWDSLPMYHNRIAARYGRFGRRYGRTDVIHDATTLLMDRFALDAAQAVAHVGPVRQRHEDALAA